MAVKMRLKAEFSQILQVLGLLKHIKRDLKWPVNDPSINVILCSSEKISILSFVLNRNIFQEFACGWGDLELNVCKNFSSDTWNVSPEACCLLKIREAVLAILLRTPAINHVCNGDAWFLCSLTANARTSHAATFDLDELILLAQPTVGVLSHHAAV
jgi:hypothetical protein